MNPFNSAADLELCFDVKPDPKVPPFRMVGWLVVAPKRSPFAGSRLRVFAHRPVALAAPETHVLLAVQRYTPQGDLDAANPLYRGTVHRDFVETVVKEYLKAGWTVTPDMPTERLRWKQEERNRGKGRMRLTGVPARHCPAESIRARKEAA